MKYFVTYRNDGRKERSPFMDTTIQPIKETVDFIKLQGAKSIKIYGEYGEAILQVVREGRTIPV